MRGGEQGAGWGTIEFAVCRHAQDSIENEDGGGPRAGLGFGLVGQVHSEWPWLSDGRSDDSPLSRRSRCERTPSSPDFRLVTSRLCRRGFWRGSRGSRVLWRRDGWSFVGGGRAVCGSPSAAASSGRESHRCTLSCTEGDSKIEIGRKGSATATVQEKEARYGGLKLANARQAGAELLGARDGDESNTDDGGGRDAMYDERGELRRGGYQDLLLVEQAHTSDQREAQS